ncbi:prolyl oligopeptidase family serine peptidase [Robiginitalea sp. M366]|uniref:prolyl oligopeptidase family serine peptidase n=1 Tax=Robiginitalea aestuariiviva TaxID=3036903 RepID=UPI00240D3578|nr:prolyl oligopeptidase family serine peptidase [Robiginitalea aestuariiviva]MDG1570848.1 prolyl oligopeptidase family serine peptidase [Robiginitalea aestuariiviva]
MKSLYSSLLFILLLTTSILPAQTQAEPSGGYALIVEGFDWGPAVNKIVLDFEATLDSVPPGSFKVLASRQTDLAELPEATISGEREVLGAYISDASGNRLPQGNYLTLVLSVNPQMRLASPFHYARNEKVRGNFWVDYQVAVTHMPSLRTWKHKTGKIMPQADRFNLDGRFEYAPGKTLSYAAYTPAPGNKKPLIIWLHGGGEGGTDPTIALLGNRAAHYASPEIQNIFGGAYVLAPQSPTFWMNREGGGYTRGDAEDIYHVGLMALIRDFVARHPGIDTDRIYVGGCSNGGYMSLKLLLEHPDYFAAGYISALAYHSEFVSDAQIRSIRNVPIWFIHSKDDPVTVPQQTVVPIYNRLMAAGARNVHFSYYDHVTDITGQYGGEDFHYSGHWSWIYSHANTATLDYDGKPVTLKGTPVTVMQWLAAQKN